MVSIKNINAQSECALQQLRGEIGRLRPGSAKILYPGGPFRGPNPYSLIYYQNGAPSIYQPCTFFIPQL